jgi:dTDP-4-amino-4,6-dideoxygalactose transaminase
LSKVIFNDLKPIYHKYSNEFKEAVQIVMESGWYILGNEVLKFEKKFAHYIDVSDAISVNSGLDALILSLRALDIKQGDEVIVPANTFIATIIAIIEVKAIPILVEPDDFFNIDVNKIEALITSNTKVIMPVHLYGQAANMTKIMRLAKKYGLFVVEDCAQSHGSSHNKRKTGSIGDIGCFSFYPTKNIGAFGDSGIITTNNPVIASKLRLLRNYGSSIKYIHEIEGINSRMDEIQASILSVKMNYIDEIISERKKIANLYLRGIKNEFIILPKTIDNSEHVFHLFVIKTDYRNELIDFLNKNEVEYQIHYPIPPHLSKCYIKQGFYNSDLPITERNASQVLSLPLYNGISEHDITKVIQVLNDFRPVK